MIALLVFTDGRDHIYETIPSAAANLHGPITSKLIHDDSGDPDNLARLTDTFGPEGFDITGSERRGFGGAIAHVWRTLLPSSTFVFHLEDDFTFRRPVDLTGMAAVLTHNPHLAQLALRRQPWNDEEREAGGVVEAHPDDYHDTTRWDGLGFRNLLEHRQFFTTNPSLYRSSLCSRGWPDAEHSEGAFTHQLLADPDLRFAYWGERDSGEAVTHIGRERAGAGY